MELIVVGIYWPGNCNLDCKLTCFRLFTVKRINRFAMQKDRVAKVNRCIETEDNVPNMYRKLDRCTTFPIVICLYLLLATVVNIFQMRHLYTVVEKLVS